MKQHNENAMVIAAHLDKHPAVQKVIYPGLSTHPQFELAKEQMSGFGGMITIDTGSAGKARDFCSKVKVFTLAESLGGVESLVCHPASMTHASVPKEKRENFGLLDSMIRLSVGIEDSDDLIEDIEQALK
jgi:cystathionine beta-lyase/cystathionine gamma-synthase